jgi:hypothetical protein
VALDVMAATGGGVLLSTGKSGTSCDVNADDDETVPADDSLDPDDWTLPDDDAFDVGIPDGDFGSGGDFDGAFGDGGSSGEEGQENPAEELDPQSGVTGISPGGPVPGDVLEWEGCGCANSTIEWYVNGVLVGTGGTYQITVADMDKGLVGIGKCNGINTCETDPIPVPVTPTAYTYWRFKPSSGAATGWFNTTNSRGALVASSTPGISPSGTLNWYIHSGTFTIASGIAGGVLGEIVALNNAGSILAKFGGYTGVVSADDPGSSTSFASPGVWEFAFSNAGSGPDAWDAQWSGSSGAPLPPES